MIKPIVKDVFFLGQKAEDATKQDLPVGQDLMDTLRANQDRCVGMAANMIGVKKKIIIVNMGIMNVVMYNPVIVKKDTPYETEEGCLSLIGVRKTMRRMTAYLHNAKPRSAEEIADEMLAIMSDRERWIAKKEAEAANARYNEILNRGLE